MVRTQVKLDPRLDERVHVCASVEEAVALQPLEVFRRAELLVIDGIDWGCDMAVVQSGLTPQRRAFKSPFRVDPVAPEVWKELDLIDAQVDRVFAQLYPFRDAKRSGSFRPMITGPEPLHFDTYGDPVVPITAFVNVSAVPRKYCISHSLPSLIRRQPKAMRMVVGECRGKVDDLSYQIRVRTVAGKPPFGRDAPRHRLDLAPGSIWFFNAKTVSHEVVYGEGAMGYSWAVSTGAATQAELVAKLNVREIA